MKKKHIRVSQQKIITKRTAIPFIRSAYFTNVTGTPFTHFITINLGIGELFKGKGPSNIERLQSFRQKFFDRLRKLFKKHENVCVYAYAVEGDALAHQYEWKKDVHIHLLLHIPSPLQVHSDFSSKSAIERTFRNLCDRSAKAMGLPKMRKHRPSRKKLAKLVWSEEIRDSVKDYYTVVYYCLKSMDNKARTALKFDDFIHVFYPDPHERSAWKLKLLENATDEREQPMQLLGTSHHIGQSAIANYERLSGIIIPTCPDWNTLDHKQQITMQKLCTKSRQRLQQLKERAKETIENKTIHIEGITQTKVIGPTPNNHSTSHIH